MEFWGDGDDYMTKEQILKEASRKENAENFVEALIKMLALGFLGILAIILFRVLFHF
jgi:hypothetical protein